VPPVHIAELHLCEPRNLAAIKCFSCYCITIWYIIKRGRFEWFFTSLSPITEHIAIPRFTVKSLRESGVFQSNSTNSDRFACLRMGCERASNTISLTYLLYCDIISTEIHNWRQSHEFEKMLYRPRKPQVPCGSSVWWGKNLCNGFSSVPTQTWNWTTNFTPLLTLLLIMC